jgi:hypothetical protein
MKTFRSFETTDKHGMRLTMFQYAPTEVPSGLSTDIPTAFRPKPVAGPPKLTLFVAFYFGYAFENREFLLADNHAGRNYAATTLLSLLSEDAVEVSESTHYGGATLARTWGSAGTSFAERYKHYLSMDFWPRTYICDYFEEKYLQPYGAFFETGGTTKARCFIRDAGLKKLRAEWPDIADRFGVP